MITDPDKIYFIKDIVAGKLAIFLAADLYLLWKIGVSYSLVYEDYISLIGNI